MDFELSDDQRAIADLAEQILGAQARPGGPGEAHSEDPAKVQYPDVFQRR